MVRTDFEPVIALKLHPGGNLNGPPRVSEPVMSDPNEIEALRASMRGVRRSAEALAGMSERVEALDVQSDVSEADLDDLQRLSSAHAVAAQALRGLVQTMLKRRGKGEGEPGSAPAAAE